MVQFDGCRLEMKLTAQTPMIHFQAGDKGDRGATVRATELKPKLDTYLLKINPSLKKDHPEFYYDAKNDDNNALKYKVQIFCEKPGKVFPLDEYSIYFGNMGRKKKGLKEIQGLISDPTLVIICLNKTLRQIIAENIDNFFLSTNFGTMQDKGFGSFLPKDLSWGKILNEDQQKRAAEALKERAGSAHCYVIEYDSSIDMKQREKDRTLISMFSQIRDFCAIMKSGKGSIPSYLFEYVGEKNSQLNNEKEWIKKRLLSSNLAGNTAFDSHSRYMRAFLGTTDSIFYKGKGKVTVNNDDKDKDNNLLIERVSNPLYFKIVRNCVFIAASPIDSQLYGKKFLFTYKEKDREKKSGTITTLRSGDIPGGFDMNDFLSNYVNYYKHIVDKRIEEVVV